MILNTIALLFISITMLARANDLRRRKGKAWKLRMIGLVCAGFAPVGIILSVEFCTTVFFVGLALVFLTTPGLPPWHKYVFGNENSDPVQP